VLAGSICRSPQRNCRRSAFVRDRLHELLADAEQQDFEDFMFWPVCRLSAKYDLLFQVYTGQARVQGSNPMLLVDTMAKRAYQEWLEAVPSDRMNWGADTVNAKGIYAVREFTAT
jgi:hypothetical protein